MKTLVLFASVLSLLLVSCSGPTVETYINEEGKTVTIKTYPCDYDTISDTLNLKVFLKNYEAEISKLCLNDKGIKKTVEDDTSILTVIHHNYAVNVKLSDKNKILIDTLIEKNVFSDSLDSVILNQLLISDFKIIEVKSNKIQFDATLTTPDSTEVYKSVIDLYYKRKRKGETTVLNIKRTL